MVVRTFSASSTGASWVEKKTTSPSAPAAPSSPLSSVPHAVASRARVGMATSHRGRLRGTGMWSSLAQVSLGWRQVCPVLVEEQVEDQRRGPGELLSAVSAAGRGVVVLVEAAVTGQIE